MNFNDWKVFCFWVFVLGVNLNLLVILFNVFGVVLIVVFILIL